VPINALVAVEGTPLEDRPTVDPLELVRMVATARILMPHSRVRLSAGREQLGREAQILCLLAGADSIFYGDTLLTTGNPDVAADRERLAAAGVLVERDRIAVDANQATNVPHIFAIGDIVGQPMLAHKAVHEAHVAAEVIAGELMQGNEELAQKLRSSAFNARVIPSVAYTDPEVAWVGLTEDQAKAQGIKVKKGLFPWAASGRAIANGRDEGVTKLLFDDSPEAHGHGKILGGGMVGTHAGDMIGEIALALEMGADAVDIGKTIHPHPTLGESIGMAAEVAHGSCTDLPPARK
jgi:pyruvate/2-oxoglutarate dehydrogenase complex dihydrolipoamide dehydrogenase (E3) component